MTFSVTTSLTFTNYLRSILKKELINLKLINSSDNTMLSFQFYNEHNFKNQTLYKIYDFEFIFV